MKVLLFGVLADVVGQSVIEAEDAKDLATLKDKLLHQYPLLNNYRYQVAVNKEKVEENILLNSKDEIALLPPFAGG